jgi:tRNA (cmo5U34)-methyltransferase
MLALLGSLLHMEQSGPDMNAAIWRSPEMIRNWTAEAERQEPKRAGERDMQPFAGRYRYVEFDMLAGEWPEAIPPALDAVVTSMCVHHLPDERKQGLFAEVFERLVPGGWYLNYDPVRAEDPVVEAAWQRASDLGDPETASRRLHRTPEEQARWENHVRYIIPLGQQLGYLRSAGFSGIDVYWKQFDNVIYGGCRPR